MCFVLRHNALFLVKTKLSVTQQACERFSADITSERVQEYCTLFCSAFRNDDDLSYAQRGWPLSLLITCT